MRAGSPITAARISDAVLGDAPQWPLTLRPARLMQAATPFHAGILYSGWHTFAATSMATIAGMGGAQLNVEQVIRSNGNLQLSQVLDKYNQR